MYSHYLPDGPHDVHDYFWHLTVEDETGPYADPERLGSVFVRTEQDGEGWSAYWIRDQERHTKDGTRTEVVAWARQQDAGHRWLYEPDGPWYLPLPPPAADSDATVYVAHVDRDDWYASWQRGEEQRGLLASRDAVLAWARSQPADHRWLWDEGRYTPLQD